jgi:chromosome segregation ATPase
MADEKRNEIYDEEDLLTRSEEIEYNLQELKKENQKLIEQRQEFAKKVKAYNAERKKMLELLKDLPKNEDDDDYDPDQMSLFDDEDEVLDTDFDECIYDSEFIKDLKLALYELNQVIENSDSKAKLRKAMNKVNKIVYEYDNIDIEEE